MMQRVLNVFPLFSQGGETSYCCGFSKPGSWHLVLLLTAPQTLSSFHHFCGLHSFVHGCMVLCNFITSVDSGCTHDGEDTGLASTAQQPHASSLYLYSLYLYPCPRETIHLSSLSIVLSCWECSVDGVIWCVFLDGPLWLSTAPWSSSWLLQWQRPPLLLWSGIPLQGWPRGCSAVHAYSHVEGLGRDFGILLMNKANMNICV